MALTSDGKLYGWGWNKVDNLLSFVLLKQQSLSALITSCCYCPLVPKQFGQVGAGDNADHCVPVHIKFPNDQACLSYLPNQLLNFICSI